MRASYEGTVRHRETASSGRHASVAWVAVIPLTMALNVALVVGVLPRYTTDSARELPPAPITQAPSPATAEAHDLFVMRCVPCHGATGAGDGIAAAALDPHPRDFRSHEWQASVRDAEIERAIVNGGESVGKSGLMPANPDLQTRPEVVTALRVYIRSLGSDGSELTVRD